MSADWLQYGELGLLALVLVGLGAGLRLWIKSVTDRAQITDAWTRSLIEEDRKERKENAERLEALVQTVQEVQISTVRILADLGKQIEESNDQAQQDREAWSKERQSWQECQAEIMSALRGGD